MLPYRIDCIEKESESIILYYHFLIQVLPILNELFDSTSLWHTVTTATAMQFLYDSTKL